MITSKLINIAVSCETLDQLNTMKEWLKRIGPTILENEKHHVRWACGISIVRALNDCHVKILMKGM